MPKWHYKIINHNDKTIYIELCLLIPKSPLMVSNKHSSDRDGIKLQKKLLHCTLFEEVKSSYFSIKLFTELTLDAQYEGMGWISLVTGKLKTFKVSRSVLLTEDLPIFLTIKMSLQSYVTQKNLSGQDPAKSPGSNNVWLKQIRSSG